MLNLGRRYVAGFVDSTEVVQSLNTEANKKNPYGRRRIRTLGFPPLCSNRQAMDSGAIYFWAKTTKDGQPASPSATIA